MLHSLEWTGSSDVRCRDKDESQVCTEQGNKRTSSVMQLHPVLYPFLRHLHGVRSV